jgi:hypothetical protein
VEGLLLLASAARAALVLGSPAPSPEPSPPPPPRPPPPPSVRGGPPTLVGFLEEAVGGTETEDGPAAGAVPRRRPGWEKGSDFSVLHRFPMVGCLMGGLI